MTSYLRLLPILTLLIISVPQFSNAQFGFEYDDSIVVKIGADTLDNPWGGGLNYAQFSDFDYDFKTLNLCLSNESYRNQYASNFGKDPKQVHISAIQAMKLMRVRKNH